jgi:NAD(P)-dependent dehydrogenase (short-subunit alcohol dehydrogenase family)
LPRRSAEPVERNDRVSAGSAPAPPFDRFDLTGRVALVTGGTRGLGRAIIRTLAQAGADIVVASRKQEACDEASAEVRSLGRRALAIRCHVGHWDQIDRLVERSYRELGQVDILVNNAGMAPTYPDPQSVSEELWDKTLAVNLKGPFRLTALVGERMIAGDGGSIVNISSIGGVRPTHDILPYAAAKAGLNALTLGFADALGPKVRVNAIMPGPFKTDISRHWDQEAFAERARTFPLRRAGDPDELSAAVLYLASDASSFTTGAVLAIDGGAQWSLAGGGDGYDKSIYDGKRDWT